MLEDGVQQRISFFALSLDVPLSLALMADVSASQRSFNEGHRHDIKEFLKDVLTPRDQAFLVCFGSRIQLVGDFTASGKSPTDEFERFEHGGGHTRSVRARRFTMQSITPSRQSWRRWKAVGGR